MGIDEPSVTTSTVKRRLPDPAWQSMARRRHRIWLNLALFFLVTCGIIVLSMAQRDHDAMRGSLAECRARLEYARDQLQALYDRTGQVAPSELPLPRADQADEDAQFVIRTHYLYNARYSRFPSAGPVGVCCCAEPHDFYLRPNRRNVLVFDGRRYELRCLSEAEFQRQAGALGFQVRKGR